MLAAPEWEWFIPNPLTWSYFSMLRETMKSVYILQCPFFCTYFTRFLSLKKNYGIESIPLEEHLPDSVDAAERKKKKKLI